jgi:hypothetical protein
MLAARYCYHVRNQVNGPVAFGGVLMILLNLQDVISMLLEVSGDA